MTLSLSLFVRPSPLFPFVSLESAMQSVPRVLDFMRLSQGCFKCVSRVFQGCFKDVSLVFQVRFKGVSKVFRGGFKGVSRIFQG